MQLPIEIAKASPVPLQHQVMTRVRELILKGRLAPGARLPSSRDLSRQLGVSRNTVVYAYDRLFAEGYLQASGRQGVFVSAQIPESALHIADGRGAGPGQPFTPNSNRILPKRNMSPLLYQRPRERLGLDFRIGRPAASLFPEKLWTRLLVEKMAGSGRRMTEYGNPAGLKDLRAAISDHLRVARGIIAHPDQVIVVAGCEEGLNIIAKVLAPPNSTVYAENPCYKGVPYVFESHGARLVPIPIDGEGLCVDTLAANEPGLVCVTPSHQFPIGVTMSLNRRLRLLDWANSAGAYVVEDDYDSDFRYDGSPLTALAGLDRSGSVIYVGTFSKSIGAGLRVGYLVVPEELIGPMREAKALLNNGNPWLEQAVIAEFIASGGFRSHLRKIRQAYLLRRNALVAQLRLHFGEVEIVGSEGGMHLTWMLPKGLPAARTIQYEALHRGLGVYSLDDSPAIELAETPFRDKALFFGYPCLSEGEIASAVGALRKVVSSLG